MSISRAMQFASPVIPAESLPAISKSRLVVDAVAFQLLWIGCVMGGALGWHGLAPSLLAIYILIHLGFITKAAPPLAAMVTMVLAGVGTDLWLTQSNLLAYSHHRNDIPIPPVWIISLWIALAFSMTASLRWLAIRPVMAFCLFGCSGMLSYRAGIALGAAEIQHNGTAAFITIALCFGLIGAIFGKAIATPRPNQS